MRIKWLKDALLDLIELRKYIENDNSHAAQDVAISILSHVEQLAEHPAMGRTGRVEGTRELVISGLPYIIPYRVKNNTIEILRVLHAARKWPTKF
ncbi:MAG: type II toxin-antitoxin system RelE/ParE family toxin [Thermodesulfovibrionales bacterium]|nr:type II toxin-antitoxin system RelE/ParE family toxin [Thermodesulfovibrionales bacterium]